jgi:hypothetical protein
MTLKIPSSRAVYIFSVTLALLLFGILFHKVSTTFCPYTLVTEMLEQMDGLRLNGKRFGALDLLLPNNIKGT